MTVRLLCVGDIHLGKRPTRVPGDLGVSAEDLGPGVAWRRSVEVALERGVHAVLLAGDVVERIEDRFRAFGVLVDGVRRLRERGIRVVAVVGNHDVEALPLLAERIPDVELLGRGEERWECARIEGEGGVAVDVWGWSFLSRIEADSPLRTFPTAPRRPGAAATIGLLHADLDSSEARYAPVQRTALASAGLDAWLLGHVHAPGLLGPDSPIGYLGSVAGTDPGEPGAHGPWAIEAGRDGSLAFDQVPVAPLRYDALEVDVTDLGATSERDDGADPADALAIRIDRCAAAWISERGSELTRTDALALRVRLVGETARAATLRAAASTLAGHRLQVDGPRTFVESIVDATRPALDVEALAADDSYPGLIARRLVALEARGPVAARLLAKARARVERDLDGHAAWRDLPEEERRVSDDALYERLERGARRTLEALARQREEVAS
ncbi:MAG: DNA repair exonuclease [Planctomycetota bacterium]